MRRIITTLTVLSRSLIIVLASWFTSSIYAQHQPMLLRLVATGNLMQNEAVVYFDSAATYDYDPQFDAPSLGVDPGQLNIVTRLNNIDYQIDAVPAITQNMIIPVKITTGTSGTYAVVAHDLNNLPQGAYVRLHDSYHNTDFDLRSGTAQYYISDTESVARFTLLVSVNMLHNVSATLTAPTCSRSGNGSIIATASGAGPFNFYWKDSSNTIVRVGLNKGSLDTLTGIDAGAYRVDVTTPGTNNNATLYVLLNASMSAQADFTFPSNVNLSNGVANVHFTNASVNAQYFSWEFGDGMGNSITNPNHTYNQVGTYTVTLSASNSTCSEISVKKKVLTINATMDMEESAGPALTLGAGPDGYYIIPPANGIISVTDLLGRQLIHDVATYGSQKTYLDPALPSNEILIVRFVGEGQKNSIKFIKQP